MGNMKQAFKLAKRSFFLLLIPVIVWTVFMISVTVMLFMEQDYQGTVLVGFGALASLTAPYPFIKRLLNPEPYIVITDDTLTITSIHNHGVPLKWSDIKTYRFHDKRLLKSIEIVLYNGVVDTYWERMSSIQRFFNNKNTPFVIVLWQVKRKDRKILFKELERQYRNDDSYVRFNDTYEANSKSTDLEGRTSPQSMGEKYMKKAYVSSLVFTIFIPLVFKWYNITMLMVMFILYPFAKIFINKVLRLERSHETSSGMNMYSRGFLFFIHMGIYYLSPFLAPFGIVWLIMRYINRSS